MKIIVFLFLLTITSNAQNIQILSEIDPPFNYIDSQNSPAGFSVEIINELKKRLNITSEIQFMPWARAYKESLIKPNTIIFSMARTKARESLFHWIGPLIDNEWQLITKSNSTLTLNSLEDAKKLKTVGVYRDDSRDQYLKGLGFKNLLRANDNMLGMKMLLAGRFDAYAMSDITIKDTIESIGKNLTDVKSILTFNNVFVYIAISKNTKEEDAKRWQDSFESMKSDGTFQKIFTKYFPNKQPPKQVSI